MWLPLSFTSHKGQPSTVDYLQFQCWYSCREGAHWQPHVSLEAKDPDKNNTNRRGTWGLENAFLQTYFPAVKPKPSPYLLKWGCKGNKRGSRHCEEMSFQRSHSGCEGINTEKLRRCFHLCQMCLVKRQWAQLEQTWMLGSLGHQVRLGQTSIAWEKQNLKTLKTVEFGKGIGW